jgi:hypothetical protein
MNRRPTNVTQPPSDHLSGELRGIQVGGRGVWRIGVSDIEDYIAEACRPTAERISAGEFKDDRESRAVQE